MRRQENKRIRTFWIFDCGFRIEKAVPYNGPGRFGGRKIRRESAGREFSRTGMSRLRAEIPAVKALIFGVNAE